MSDDPDETARYRDHVIYWAKDLGRTIDYLETRTDLKLDKLVYYGLSTGAYLGNILPAMETRIKVSVLLSGGFESAKKLPEVDEINFAPRVKVPTLMVNGRYDHFFPLETSQRVALPQDAGFGEGRDLRRPPCAIQSFLMASYSAID